ncbi:hypothetical protein [Syntrophaceticus schinkii]|uniref:Uncharacterized protein n=1 Tax=Syntrophaceticus schinkii TaxID=499207 RepID=A0A0B7MFV9_9FIRM|nr:hypothetical protein [Syntrophaceticus schinkii]CEO89504.1 hypothetical protein SSCH_500004 [Syntrophaceticus schinkii]
MPYCEQGGYECYARSFGGVVGEDMLPDDDEMKSMFQQAGFASIEISDSDRGYLLTARRYQPRGR